MRVRLILCVNLVDHIDGSRVLFAGGRGREGLCSIGWVYSEVPVRFLSEKT